MKVFAGVPFVDDKGILTPPALQFLVRLIDGISGGGGIIDIITTIISTGSTSISVTDQVLAIDAALAAVRNVPESGIGQRLAQVESLLGTMLALAGGPLEGKILRLYFSAVPGPYLAAASLFGEPIEMLGDELFPAGMLGSVGSCQTAPTGPVTLPMTSNGTPIGTVNFAASSTVATFTLTAKFQWPQRALFDLLAPSPVDATFNGPRVTFVGTRTV